MAPLRKISIPQRSSSHQTQESPSAQSLAHLLCLTIQIHLTMERPSPDRAPHRPAIVLNRQIEHKNPIQLKKKAMTKAHKNMPSVPSVVVLNKRPSCAEISSVAFEFFYVCHVHCIIHNIVQFVCFCKVYCRWL